MVIPPGSSRQQGWGVPWMGAFGGFPHGQKKLETDFALLQANEVGPAMLRGVLWCVCNANGCFAGLI